jgi:hypothetical protein
MLTQQEWVEGCYAYYSENGYEPGNPEDGNWQECHYPTPKCLGGETTILLLKQHHAVQGVLQCEEYSHPCVWGWEHNYLTGEMLALYKKWKATCAHQNLNSPEQRKHRRIPEKTFEERSRDAKKAWETRRRNNTVNTLTPEQQTAKMLKAWETRRNRNTQTPEQLSEAARRGWETRRRNSN